MKLKTNRMEALVDGIFAIIMTIMIVSFIEVLGFANPAKEADFHRLFLSLRDDFVVYAASFLILGIIWLEHHWQFHYIKYIDPALVFINIIWLMFLCLIPFTAMFLGNHHKFIVPALAFELNILIVFLILYIHWIYAVHKDRLVEASLDKKTLARHRNIGLFLIIFTLSAVVLTLPKR